VTDSPLSAGEVRAAAETHSELGPEYRDAVLESFVDRVGREIDARVDARLAQAAARGAAPQPVQPAPVQRAPRQFNPMVMALGSMALGVPLSGIAAPLVGFWGLLVVWVAIAVINLGYAVNLGRAARQWPPGDHR
jgi:hypothetical protein